MALIGWVETGTDLAEWYDAPEDVLDLERYLMAAYEQCRDYAPAPTEWLTDVFTDTFTDVFGETMPVVPVRYKLAQVMQARALYRSLLAGSGDAIGVDGLSVTVWPMDWTVKNLLRPKRIGRVL